MLKSLAVKIDVKVVVIHISCRKMLLQITLEKRIQGDAWPATESGFFKLTVCTSMICANCVSLFFGFIVFLNHKVFLQNFFFSFDIDFKRSLPCIYDFFNGLATNRQEYYVYIIYILFKDEFLFKNLQK